MVVSFAVAQEQIRQAYEQLQDNSSDTCQRNNRADSDPVFKPTKLKRRSCQRAKLINNTNVLNAKLGNRRRALKTAPHLSEALKRVELPRVGDPTR